MTCRELIDFLDEYEAGTQSPEVRAEFERHLSACPECRDYLKTYRDTLNLARASCEEHGDRIPDDVPVDLVRGVLAAQRSGGRVPRGGV